jgi:hypothetical protein
MHHQHHPDRLVIINISNVGIIFEIVLLSKLTSSSINGRTLVFDRFLVIAISVVAIVAAPKTTP